MRNLASLLSCLALLFFMPWWIAAPSLGQQTPNAAPGFRSDSVYDFENIDEVSLFNGALSVTIPIGIEYPVAAGGFSYQLALRYTSSPWDSQTYSDPCTEFGGCPIEFQPKQTHNAGLGWRLNLPELIPRGNRWNQTLEWIYVSADGGEHVFYDRLHNQDAEDTGDSGVGANQLVEYTRDGSYLRLKRPSSNATTAVVEMPNGYRHHFEQVSTTHWRLTRMEDTYGNGLDITYGTDAGSNETWTLDDGHREHVVTFTNPGSGFPNQPRLISKIELAAFDNDTATYNFTYADKTATRPPAHNHPSLNRNIDVKVLQRIALPAGTFYTFGSTSTPAYQGNGMLTQMRLPTLGYLEWDWSTFNFPLFRTLPPNQEDQEAIDPFNVVMAVTQKRQKNINSTTFGEWTYTRELDHNLGDPDLPEKLTVTVDRPSGDQSKHYFSVYPAKDLVGQPPPQWGTRWNEYSLPYTREHQDPQGGNRYLSSEIFDCNDSGNNCEMVRSVYVAYALDNDSNFNDATGILFNKNRRLTSRRTFDHYQNGAGDDVTDWRLEEYSGFDGLGHHRTMVSTSNFGPARTSVTNYNGAAGTYPGSFTQLDKNDAWLISLYDFQTTSEGGQTAKREFCFTDKGSLDRLRILRLSNGARDGKDVVHGFSYDAQGQMTRQTWRGGDTVGTNPMGTGDLCDTGIGNALFTMDHTHQYGVVKTSRFAGTGGVTFPYSTQHTSIDVNTGLVKTTVDGSGLATDFVFDTSGRLTLISPNAASGAAATKIFYGNAASTSNPARVEVRELKNGSVDNNDAFTEKRYRYDGLGRLARERVRRPVGFADRYHTYDGDGRPFGTSVWGTNAHATSSEDMDPFGRPRLIYPPDANSSNEDHAIQIRYEGFRKTIRTVKIGTSIDSGSGSPTFGSVVENNVSRTEQYDAYGRLIAVTEPSNPNGGNVTTTYSYDVGNRLTRAETPLSSSLNQVRTWTYDQRGFLNQECHPEKGTGGNGCVTYLRYDSMGQARKVVDGPFTRLYDYDSASRLTGIRQDLGGNNIRFLKQFTYGASSSGGNWAKGKIVQTIGYQYLDFGTGLESRMIEDFKYQGPGGARDYRKLTWKKPCGPDDGGKPDCQDGGTFSTEEVFEHRETFDDAGKLLSVEYPICIDRDDGCGPQPDRTVSYSYHAPSGFLTSVSEVSDSGSSDWASSITYHGNMTVNRLTHGNGVVDVQGLDPNSMGRPASLHSEGPGGETLWQSGTFRFDGAGNLIEQEADIFTDRFVYDGVSRLKQSSQWLAGSAQAHIFSDSFESGDTSAWVENSGTPPSNYSEQLFTYDIAGNLRTTTTDGNTDNHQVNTLTNRLSNASYDSAGNVTQYIDGEGVTVSLQWDPQNRLEKRTRGGSSTYYLYTADDERVMRFGPEGFVWTLRDLRGQVLREFRPEAAGSSGSSTNMVAQRDQIYRGSSLLGTVTKVGVALTEQHHYSLDHLGSPRLVTDASGQVEAEHKYYPYGEEATSSTQDSHPMKFTGHERDFNEPGEGNDLDYMHARYCDPFKGRFLSVDPVLGTPGDPQSWNRYAYAGDNPLKFVDPDGRAILLATAGLGALEGAAFQLAINVISEQPLLSGVGREAALGAAMGATGVGLAHAGRKGIQAFRAAKSARSLRKGSAPRGTAKARAPELAVEEVFQQAAERGPELVNGFRVFGNKGLVGKTFQRNIFLLEAEKIGARSPRHLLRSFEAEAREAGAKELRIVGHAVVNEKLVNPRLVERFGFQFRQINEDTIELLKELP